MTSTKPLPALRILLVDDSATASRITQRYLAAMRTPSSVEWVADAHVAIEALCENRHDVCLLDLHLDGGATGFEVLRTANAAGCTVPTIILTSDSAHEADVEASAAGAVDFLVKGELTTILIDRAVRYAHASGARQREVEEARRLNEEIRQLRAQKAADDALRVAEAAVHDSEARSRASDRRRLENLAVLEGVIEGTTDSILVKDRSGRFLFVNRAGARRLGCTAAEVVGKTSAEVSCADVHDGGPNTDAAVLESGRTITSEEIVTEGTVTRSFHSIKAPLRDKDGEIIGVIAIARDVTVAKLADLALRESEARFRAMAECAAVGIFMTDVEGNCLYANPELQRQIGGGPERALGRKWLDAVHPDDREELLAVWGEAVRGSSSYAVPFRYLRPDGVATWTASSGVPIRDGDKVLGYVGASLDVTPQRAAEAALRVVEEQLRHSQRMDAIGQLAAGVAHDFNNLLLVIDCCTEFLGEEVLTPTSPGYEDLTQISRASARAAGLTRQLLAFSRRQVLRPAALDPNAVVSSTEPMLRRLIGADVAILMDLAPALSSVRADAGQFEQVLVNLVVNARDAMPSGGTITVATRHMVVDEDLAREHRVTPGGYVALSVRDTGRGIPASVLGRIFEPFFTTKGPGQGTGLGLATVYGAVHQSGGFIRVESEEGRGSVFEIALRCEVSSVAPPSAVVVPAIAPRGRERILLAEDEPAVRALTKRILERHGYEVVAASDGAEAVRIADRDGHFDLLVTDMVMPGINGRELYERLRALHPTMAVVFLSGYSDDEIFRRGILAGSIEFVNKPFTSAQLTTVVHRALGDPARIEPFPASASDRRQRSHSDGARRASG